LYRRIAKRDELQAVVYPLKVEIKRAS
jgi:hypothetical protein